MRLVSRSDASRIVALPFPNASDIAYSVDGTRIAVSGGSHGIDICDSQDPEVYVLNVDIMPTCMTFHPDDQHLAVAVLDSIFFYNFHTGQLVKTIDLKFEDTNMQTNSLVFQDDGIGFVVAIGTTIQIGYINTGQVLVLFRHTKIIKDLAVCPNTARIAFCDEDHSCFHLDCFGEQVTAMEIPSKVVTIETIFSLEKTVIVDLRSRDAIRIWDISSNIIMVLDYLDGLVRKRSSDGESMMTSTPRALHFFE